MRLTPQEREARKRERAQHSFSDAAYRHYDPTAEGYGNPRDWMDAAEALAQGRGAFVPSADGLDPLTRAALAEMGLTSMPLTATELKSAFRVAAFSAHPDHGGTNERFKKLLAAFERLVNKYRKV